MCSCKWVAWLRRVSILPAKRSYTVLHPTAYKGIERINVSELQKLVLNKYMLSTHPPLLHKHGCCEILTLKHIMQGNWGNKTRTPNFFCSVNSLPYLPSLHEKLTHKYKNPPKQQIFCITAIHMSIYSKGHMLIQPFDFHWPSQHDSLWTTIAVSALDAYYIVVRKHSQSDELDHSGHGSPYTKALYILLASKSKNIKATINLIGPHLTAFINMQTSIFTLSETKLDWETTLHWVPRLF